MGFRGVHNEIGLECINCHGKIEDVAVALLVSESNSGKSRGKELIKLIDSQYHQQRESVSSVLSAFYIFSFRMGGQMPDHG